MKDEYTVHLYHDTVSMVPLRTFEDESMVEDFCSMLYFQLRAMGASGEIRVSRVSRRKYGSSLAVISKQVAFVNLNWYKFRYERTN